MEHTKNMPLRARLGTRNGALAIAIIAGGLAAIVMSTIVLFELRFGIAGSARRERNEAVLAHFMTLPLTVAPFEPAIRQRQESRGPISSLSRRQPGNDAQLQQHKGSV